METKRQSITKIFIPLFALFLILTSMNPKVLAESTDVEAFVTRFYQQCLNREPDTDGLVNWMNSLNNGDKTGDELAEAFVFSQEFLNRNTSDAEFVSILYRAFFNREPDSDGYNNWMKSLSNGTNRSDILDGFTSAQEFEILCQRYGITANSSETNTSVAGFVTRFYQQCLNREPDTDGLANWMNSLNNGEKTGDELAEAFVFSQEFQNRNTSDAEFVVILYRAFFNREPDSDGYNNWMNSLSNGTNRSDILDGFTSAQEFKTLCQNYGITANQPAPNCINLNGANFRLTEVRDLRNCGGPANDIENSYLTVTQNGCNASFRDEEGSWETGTFSGNKIIISSSWWEDGGIVKADYTVTFANDGNSFQGTATATWSDGYSSCSPTSTVSGSRY